MQGYAKTTWSDRVVQYPSRYVDQNNNQYTFTPDAGTVTNAGTSVSASNMNNMEDGIKRIYNNALRKIRMGGLV